MGLPFIMLQNSVLCATIRIDALPATQLLLMFVPSASQEHFSVVRAVFYAIRFVFSAKEMLATAFRADQENISVVEIVFYVL